MWFRDRRATALVVSALLLPGCDGFFDDSQSLTTDPPAEEEASVEPDGAEPSDASDVSEVGDESAVPLHGPGRTGPTYEIDFYLSDKSQATTLTYQEIDGVAIVEGDIMLGNSDELQNPRPRESEPVCSGDICSQNQGLSVIYGESYLWPGGVIPYEISPDFGPQARVEIGAGIDLLGVTNLVLRPRDGERDYIEFVPHDGCLSFVGRQVGRQTVKLLNPGCGAAGVAHEILHAAGLWHEHSRGDRDAHITILWDNIEPEWQFAFDMHATDGIDVGPYDVGSIMHYHGTAFARTDPATGLPLPTIQTVPPGGVVGGAAALTADDIAGLAQLYPPSTGAHYEAIPGPVFGLRHSQNQSNDFIGNPVVQFGDVAAQRVLGGDLGAPAGVGFEWWMVPTDAPWSTVRIDEVPPGVVMAMWHSQNMSNMPGDFRLTSVSGGDLGAPAQEGFVWYENSDMTNVNWDLVDVLPPYTVVGLKHSENQRDRTFVWSDGLTYDPLISCPDGFDRTSGGDLGAPSGQGFFWCERR